MFQIHLWTGIGVGLYVLVICVTGSMLVFRPELSRVFVRKPVIVNAAGPLLTDDQIKEVARRQNPGFVVTNVYREKPANAAAEVWLESPTDSRRRMVDPFTGEDIGPAQNLGMTMLYGLLDLHDNLLTGENGRLVNGAGGLLLTILSLTGVVIWWPGIRNWARSLMLHGGVNWKRFTWDLHSAVGFWTGIFVFMFAVTGFYLVYQEWFNPIAERLVKYAPETFGDGRIDDALAWLPRLHFGRFRFRGMNPNLPLTFKILWVILGLAPALLSVTGVLMWWNRVLRKVRLPAAAPEPAIAQSVSLETVSTE